MTSDFFFIVRHRDPLLRLLCQGQPRPMMCYRCCSFLLPVPLLCLRYVFAADPRVCMVIVQSTPLDDVSPHLKAERRIYLLRKLNEYRLGIDINMASRWRLRDSVVFVWYAPVRYAAASCSCCTCFTNVIAGASYCPLTRSTAAHLTV